MKQSNSSLGGRWRWGLALLLFICPVGCQGEDGHPATYQYEATPASNDDLLDRCAAPNQGCPCATPGEVLDCGKVTVKVDEYETCYEGSRICTEAGTWGACVPDQAIVQLTQ